MLFAGNGGSAGDAQHLAGEFLSRLNYDRAPLPAIALTTDSSVLTAIGNDYGYDRVFERQVLGLGVAGDVLIAISTSGRSPNILRAIEAARSTGLVVVGFTGRSGGEMAARCHLCLYAPADTTPLIQQLHITAGHIICGLVEERLFPKLDQPRRACRPRRMIRARADISRRARYWLGALTARISHVLTTASMSKMYRDPRARDYSAASTAAAIPAAVKRGSMCSMFVYGAATLFRHH